MDLTGKPFETSDRKKISEKNTLDLAKKTVERKGSESKKITYPLQTVRIKLNKTWRKSIQIGAVGNLQNWN